MAIAMLVEHDLERPNVLLCKTIGPRSRARLLTKEGLIRVGFVVTNSACIFKSRAVVKGG